jgi:hypothetical protein
MTRSRTSCRLCLGGGLDAEGDGMRIVVTLVKMGDVAVFDPIEG